MSTILQYRSYAKINLYLDVLDKRSDGYNNIETIFQTVSLADTLSFSATAQGLSLTCSDKELEGESNLVFKAARLLQKETASSFGAKMHLEKKIPIAAGLAGGSGNAAATLIGLNELWDLQLSMETLRELALELGSDVPYCTLGGAAGATGRGEALFPLKPLPQTWFVLLHPPLAISAGHTYTHPALGRNTETRMGDRSPSFERALDTFESGALDKLLFNRMDRPVFQDHPELEAVKEKLIALGSSAAIVSGSGPTILGLCASEAEARRIAHRVDDYESSVVHSLSLGVERIA